MAAKQDRITLTLDFNVEKAKLQELSNLLNKDIGKGFNGSKSLDYFNGMKNSINDVYKISNSLYKNLSKPLVSKTQAKQFASTLEGAFKDLDRKLISIQGNVEKTFNALGNMEALAQIRALDKEIKDLNKDYKKITELQNLNKTLGNKTELKSRISKDRKALNDLTEKSKTTKLTKDELALQKSLNASVEENNQKLKD